MSIRYEHSENKGYVLLPLCSLEIRKSQEEKKYILDPVDATWTKATGEVGKKQFTETVKGWSLPQKGNFVFIKKNLKCSHQ